MPAARNAACVGRRVARFQNQQRQPFVAFEEIAVVGAEQFREAVAAELVRLGQRQQFDEAAGKLDDVVVRAPRVAVARADGEAEAAIERGGGVEIAHRMDDMVEAARHGMAPIATSSAPAVHDAAIARAKQNRPRVARRYNRAPAADQRPICRI